LISKCLGPTDVNSFDGLQGSFVKPDEGEEDDKLRSSPKSVDAGLIISPIRLTEDMPINISEDETKFSSVTIDLDLSFCLN
jgi:hypothetical protein